MPNLAPKLFRTRVAGKRRFAASLRHYLLRQLGTLTFVSCVLCLRAPADEPKPIIAMQSLTFPTIGASRHGTQVAIGGRQKDGGAGVCIYDSSTWKLKHEIFPKGPSVKSVAFSADGKRLFGAIGKEIVVWQLPGGDEVGRLSRHTADVFSLALSGDGALLISAGEDGRIMRWNVQDFAHVDDFEPHAGWIRALDCHAESGSLAAAGDKGLFRVWERGDPKSGLDVISAGTESLFGIRYSPEGKWAAAVSDNGKIAIANLADVNKARLYQIGHLVAGIAWLNDGRTLGAGVNRTVALLDRDTGKVTKRLHSMTSTIYSIECDKANQYLIVGTFSGEIKVWNCDELLKWTEDDSIK